MTESSKLISVLLPLPFDITFSYLAASDIPLGQVVKVPFGSRELIGVVYPSNNTPNIEEGKLKHVTKVYDDIKLGPDLLEFIERVASYNIIAKGLVLKMMIGPTLVEGFAKSAPAKLNIQPSDKKVLSDEQLLAASKLIEKQDHGFSVTLLDGITGSGKTEVYLEVAEKVMAQGKQVLVMLPEIVLTTQLLQRFTVRFGFIPQVWHSGITPKLKKQTWKAVIQGDAKLVVGARSSLFLPFASLGLIIIDEEHDGSFKQDEPTIYNARDMAIVRAQISKIPVILSSATPSIETIYNVALKKYDAVELHSRFGEATLPTIKLVDMRQENIGKSSISDALKMEIENSLNEGKQSLVYLNRRGYAPVTLCSNCRNKFACPNCSSWLVEHRKKNILQCHHCAHTVVKYDKCLHCGEEGKMVVYGQGVEKIAEEIQEIFPKARVEIISSDNIKNTKDADAIIKKIVDHEVDIIIGTQIIAKGVHFPKLRLVGVVDTDINSLSGDIRAIEKTYQLLQQVAGRAGREADKGLVLLQTLEPESKLLQPLVNYDRAKFIELELEDRRSANMPPFSRLAIITATCFNESNLIIFMREMGKLIPDGEAIQVLGPAPSPMLVLRNRYRYRFILRAAKTAPMQKFIRAWLSKVKVPASIRIKVDIDPYNFM